MPAADLGEALSSKRNRMGAAILKTALVVAGVGSPLWQSWGYSKQIAAHPPLYGIWEVDSLVCSVWTLQRHARPRRLARQGLPFTFVYTAWTKTVFCS
jgi:hypothetical protein